MDLWARLETLVGLGRLETLAVLERLSRLAEAFWSVLRLCR